MRGLTVEYHLVDSCNLRCAGCSHFSSLIDKPTYRSVETIISDLGLLKEKVGDGLMWVRLMGGEPLLHPDITECLEKVRELLPKTRLSLITNGLLLYKMPQVFYEACKTHKIEVRLTDYGIIDLQAQINSLKKQGIKASVYKTTKGWRYQNIRLTEERVDCFKDCRLKNICNNYRDGKLFLCPQIAYVETFNERFGTNIKVDESDYIDIKTINSFDELQEKLKQMQPNFCYQYCNPNPVKGTWKRTEKNIEEFCLINNPNGSFCRKKE